MRAARVSDYSTLLKKTPARRLLLTEGCGTARSGADCNSGGDV